MEKLKKWLLDKDFRIHNDISDYITAMFYKKEEALEFVCGERTESHKIDGYRYSFSLKYGCKHAESFVIHSQLANTIDEVICFLNKNYVFNDVTKVDSE